MRRNIKKSKNHYFLIFVLALVVAVIGCFYYNLQLQHHQGADTAPIVNVKIKERFTSSWVNGLTIPAASTEKVLDDIDRDYSRPESALWLNQASLLYPTVVRLCAHRNIDPDAIMGLIIQESQGSPLQVDYAFKGGISNKSHIGVGQLSFDRVSIILPKSNKVQTNKRLIHIGKLALLWRKHHKEAAGKPLFKQWVKEDPRFDALSNLTQTINEFSANFANSGDETLAIMAHHGGSHDPITRVCLYAQSQGKKLKIRQVASYVKEHKLNYFILAESKDSGARYWIKKGDGHLTYCRSVVAWAEIFSRYRLTAVDRPQAIKRYPGEVPFVVARQNEHTLWWRGKPAYQNVNDLIRAQQQNLLTTAPLDLAQDGIVLSSTIGSKDISHILLYRLASAQVWKSIVELGQRVQHKHGHASLCVIESLVRTVSYTHKMGRGAANTSHNFGGAYDISLTHGGLTTLHQVLYEMAQEGKLSYYIESNVSHNGALAVFKTPYDFRKGGQVHVIVNPDFPP